MFYLLDKPKGISSFKAINNFAKENNIKKVGHTGTLDPMATGLLLIATDSDTKLINYVDKGLKSYRTEIKFGYTSDTFDAEGEVTKTNDENISLEQFKKITSEFIGVQQQMPPSFSAKKINGVRAYKLARENKEVELKSVEVEITKIENIKEIEANVFSFEVEVSRGTYIRSLVHDMGSKANGAIMTELRRIEVAGLTEADINTKIDYSRIIDLPKVSIDSLKDLFDGKPVKSNEKDGQYAIYLNNDVIGITNIINGEVKPIKLLGSKYKEHINESV